MKGLKYQTYRTLFSYREIGWLIYKLKNKMLMDDECHHA